MRICSPDTAQIRRILSLARDTLWRTGPLHSPPPGFLPVRRRVCNEQGIEFQRNSLLHASQNPLGVPCAEGEGEWKLHFT
jgi:hypothetical protein